MSGLSNYPPGVTGNEREIAGPDTLTVTRECKGTEARVYPAYYVDQLITDEEIGTYVLEKTAVTTEYECPFTGQVDAEVYNYELFWTCPTCGYENVESWGGPEEFDEPDDDDYDSDPYYYLPGDDD